MKCSFDFIFHFKSEFCDERLAGLAAHNSKCQLVLIPLSADVPLSSQARKLHALVTRKEKKNKTKTEVILGRQ